MTAVRKALENLLETPAAQAIEDYQNELVKGELANLELPVRNDEDIYKQEYAKGIIAGLKRNIIQEVLDREKEKEPK